MQKGRQARSYTKGKLHWGKPLRVVTYGKKNNNFTLSTMLKQSVIGRQKTGVTNIRERRMLALGYYPETGV